MSLLLETLVWRPDLAGLVKYLAIGPSFGDQRDELVEVRERGNDAYTAGLKVASSSRAGADFPHPDQDRWPPYATLSQLVVAQTHSLETLVLSGEIQGP
ncbi:hypothetical protein PG996_015591 [Apiospora saccharicola]|uniref:Uncharacterized protein n=1 Tax=Apiospora saccharicola TaxID=335842 RepID=A0ABR1TMA5_9PEZI